MEIIKDERYEEIAATYQCLEIGRLNEILKHHGITDRNLREKICAEFALSSGQFLDSGWFVSEETRFHLELGFSEHPHDSENSKKLHVQTDEFAFHEYAPGDIEWYFDEHGESTEEIEHGIG